MCSNSGRGALFYVKNLKKYIQNSKSLTFFHSKHVRITIGFNVSSIEQIRSVLNVYSRLLYIQTDGGGGGIL